MPCSLLRSLCSGSTPKPNLPLSGTVNKVALLQLATKNDCFLFRLNRIGYPNELEELMGNPDIRKIGLSLRDDFAPSGNDRVNDRKTSSTCNRTWICSGLRSTACRRYTPSFLTRRYRKVNVSLTGRHPRFHRHNSPTLQSMHGPACAYIPTCRTWIREMGEVRSVKVFTGTLS